MRFVDIHSHLIPGLDDGPRAISETIEMLRSAWTHGTRGMVATPHAFHSAFPTNDPLTVNDTFVAMTRELEQQSQQPGNAFLSEIALYLGAENYVSPEFLAALEQRNLLTLHGSRYLLVEFPPFLPLGAAEAAIEAVLAAGLIPVLAHVERYDFLELSPGRLARLKNQGCVVQVNAEAIVDPRGWGAGRSLNSLLEAGLVDVIASDGHDVRWRAPSLERAFEILRQNFSAETVAVWMWENPARILQDRGLAPPVASASG